MGDGHMAPDESPVWVQSVQALKADLGAGWPWASNVTSLNLSFFRGKMQYFPQTLIGERQEVTLRCVALSNKHFESSNLLFFLFSIILGL